MRPKWVGNLGFWPGNPPDERQEPPGDPPDVFLGSNDGFLGAGHRLVAVGRQASVDDHRRRRADAPAEVGHGGDGGEARHLRGLEEALVAVDVPGADSAIVLRNKDS